MSLATRKWGRVFLLLGLWIAYGTPSALGLEPAHGPALTLNPSDREVLIPTAAEVMCDPSGNISLEAAQSGTYIPLGNELPTSDQCHGYWARANLRAASLPPGGWVVKLSREWWHAELYYEHDGVVSVLRTGTALPPQERAIASSDVVIPLPVDADRDNTLYVHVVGDTSRYGESRSIGAEIQRLDAWVLHRRSVIFGQGVYAGIILALVLYNLVLYFSIRERAYLCYSLFVCLFGAIWIARTGFFYQYLWPHHPFWEREYQSYLAALAIIFSILFVREFLATRQRSPWVDSLLLGALGVTIGCCVVRLVTGRLLLPLPLALIGLALAIFYAVIGFIALARGFRPARFFLVAWTAVLLGSAIYIFMFLRFLPVNFFTYNAAQMGSATECILLAFALADRVNLLKQENDEKQSRYTLELREQVSQRTVELTTAVEKLKAASITDPLTGLSNRRHVDAAIQPWIAELQRARIRNSPDVPKRYLALCLSDLDHFKLVNDELGHAVGDKVLQAVAETLRQNVRATAILARWGGEEFLVLDHVTDPEEELLMAERLRLAILDECQPIFGEIGRSLTLSLGVVRYPFSTAYPELLSWDHCMALADHALYGAKNAGRNRWQCYRANETALLNAIHKNGIEEVRRLLRMNTVQAFELGLIEVVEQVTSEVQAI
jgi:diguanylate cyclase (GGDEF)-like protein